MDFPPSQTNDNQRDTSRYTLSVEDASALLAEAGVPRSPRSVQRYCRRGILDAILIDTDMNEKFLIDPESVDRRIVELQQIAAATGDASGRDASGQVATGRVESRQQQEREDTEARYKERIEALENENENLRIDNRVNRELANFVRGQNKELISTMNEQSRLLGRLETELYTLQAPREERLTVQTAPNQDAAPEPIQDANFRDAGREGDNAFPEREPLP